MIQKQINKVNGIIKAENSLIKPSGKFFDIVSLKFDKEFMYLNADSSLYKIKLKGYSDKLYRASLKEKVNYKISPDGYGVSWEKLDEDLSLKSLIRVGKKLDSKQQSKMLKPGSYAKA